MCRYRKNQVQLSVTIQVAGKEKTEPSIIHLRFPDNPLSVQQQTVILVDVFPFRLCLQLVTFSGKSEIMDSTGFKVRTVRGFNVGHLYLPHSYGQLIDKQNRFPLSPQV